MINEQQAVGNSGSTLSRRDFVRVATGAVAMGPAIISARALGAEGAPPPSEKITIALVGCGGQGRNIMGGAIQFKNVEVVGVCDVNEKNREEALKMLRDRYGRDDFAQYKDYRELLARPDIDAVLVATPDHWHALVCIEAARQKKAIYCEKPLTWSLGEGRAVVNAVKKAGVVFQVGSMQRSSAEMKYACEVVRNGYLGKITHINVGLPDGGHAKWVEEWPAPPAWLDYDFYVGPAEWIPYHENRLDWDWRWNMNFGGGQMMDWIGHHGDIAHMGMGWDDRGPVEVTPVLWEYSTEKNNLYNGPKNYIFDCLYEGGITMRVGNQSSMPDVFRECGDTGTQWFGDNGQWIFVSRGGLKASNPDLLKIKFKDKDFRFRKERNHMRDFLDCVRENRECIAPVEAGHRSASIGHLGKIACLHWAHLKWDYVNERITNHESLNSVLTRHYREGYTLPQV